MTTFQKSKLLWIGGGIAGGIIGACTTDSGFKVAGSALLGALLVGAFGDAVLEQEQRTGTLSLIPLGR